MKKFMAVYLGNEESMRTWKGLDENARKEREQAGIKAWGKWVDDNKKFILDVGAPLGKTKLTNAKGVSDKTNELTAYTVVQADSHEAAAKLFLNHPHFTIFPGHSVEIMECLQIPGL